MSFFYSRFAGILLLAFAFQILQAQSFKPKMHDYSTNFYQVVQEAEAYFESHPSEEGSGFKGFQRWRYNNEYKFYPSGDRHNVDPYFAAKAYQQFIQENTPQGKSSQSNSWRDLGPYTLGTITGHYSPGLGRVESFYVNPANPQLIYIGSRSGGFWKSTDGGNSWSSSTTDFLVASGVNAIAVSPTNPDSILINVRNADNGTSHGVYRSTDGGTSWLLSNFSPTNLGWGGLGSNQKVYTIEFDPVVPGKVLVGTSRGLYVSHDYLQTFTRLLPNTDITDIAFHPSDTAVLYVYDNYYWGSNQDIVLVSTDGGQTFGNSAVLNSNGQSEVKLSVSPQCDSCLYAASNNGVWKSKNRGADFQFMTNPNKTCDGFVVNDQDTAEMIYGMLDIYASHDGGQNFNQATWWAINSGNPINGNTYVHADLREAKSINGIYYVATDGYLAKSDDLGQTWQRLSDGVGIRENYSLGASQSNYFRTICGSQDNGTSINTENGWLEFYGADGMEGIIHPLNPDYMIGSVQYGTRRQTKDGGFSQKNVTPANQDGAWVAPMAYDPTNQMKVYSFGENIYRSSDFGDSWTNVGTPGFSNEIMQAAISPLDSNLIVVSRHSNLEISTDGGASFSSINLGLPTSTITDIAFAPHNDDVLAVTYGSYQNNNQKVFLSTDRGQTWQNITGNLGNMPLRAVVIDHTPQHNIYVGAEIGVYTRPLNGNNWTIFNTNLPNCTMSELEVINGTNTLRGVTWGRGLWETDLKGRTTFPKIRTTTITDPPSSFKPMSSVDQWVHATVGYSGTISEVWVQWSANSLSLDSTITMVNLSDSTWESIKPLPDLAIGGKMYFKVLAVGSNGDTSETYRFMYQYRKPEYCQAAGASNTTANYIDRVALHDLFNTSGKDSYGDFTNVYANLEDSTQYQLIVGMNYSFDLDTMYAWIDYDQNFSFDLDELIVLGPINANHESTAMLNTPGWLGTDTLRMRIRSRYWDGGPDPCYTYTGEVEDYSIVLKGYNIGVEENKISGQADIYPNPSRGFATLKLPVRAAQCQVEVLDIRGKLMRRFSFAQGTEFDLPISDLPAGMFVIKWHTPDLKGSLKLINEARE